MQVIHIWEVLESIPIADLSDGFSLDFDVCVHLRVYRAHQKLRSLAPVWMMTGDDNDGQMIFGDLRGLKLPDICFTGEEKPHPRNLSQLGIEPGPVAWQARMLPPGPLWALRWMPVLLLARIIIHYYKIQKTPLANFLQLTPNMAAYTGHFSLFGMAHGDSNHMKF